MKKILCYLLLAVMLVLFSSCETKKDDLVYEVVYDSDLMHEKYFLDIDPLTLEPGEACFATLTVYENDELLRKVPCIVSASRNSSPETKYVFKEIAFDGTTYESEHKSCYNGNGTWDFNWDGYLINK